MAQGFNTKTQEKLVSFCVIFVLLRTIIQKSCEYIAGEELLINHSLIEDDTLCVGHL